MKKVKFLWIMITIVVFLGVCVVIFLAQNQQIIYKASPETTNRKYFEAFPLFFDIIHIKLKWGKFTSEAWMTESVQKEGEDYRKVGGNL